MPQTREHFEICRLLQGPGRVRRAHQGGPRRRGHARTGAGSRCASLSTGRSSPTRPSSRCRRGRAPGSRRCAQRCATSARGAGGRPADGRRAPADRSRVLGEGVRHRRHRHARVGRLAVEDALAVVPGDRAVKVRGLQVHGSAQPAAVSGAARRRRISAASRSPTCFAARRWPRRGRWRRRGCSTRASRWWHRRGRCVTARACACTREPAKCWAAVALSSRAGAAEAAPESVAGGGAARPVGVRPGPSRVGRLACHAWRPVRAACVLAVDHDCGRRRARSAAAARRHPHAGRPAAVRDARSGCRRRAARARTRGPCARW